jgi:hypothetical protein
MKRRTTKLALLFAIALAAIVAHPASGTTEPNAFLSADSPVKEKRSQVAAYTYGEQKNNSKERGKNLNYWKPLISHPYVLNDYASPDSPPEQPVKEGHVIFTEKFSQLQYTIYAAVSGKQLIVALFDDAGHFLDYYIRNFLQQPDFELFKDKETNKVFIKEILNSDSGNQITELFEVVFSRPSISLQTLGQPASRISGPIEDSAKEENKIFNYWKPLISHRIVLDDYHLRDAPPQQPVKENHVTFTEKFSQLQYTIYAAVSGKQLLVALFDDGGHFLNYRMQDFPQQPDFELFKDKETNKVLIEILTYDSVNKQPTLFEVVFSRPSISPQIPRRPDGRLRRPPESVAEPNQPQPEDMLEGREVVVRLYDYWRFEPYRFRQAKMMLEQLEEFKKITIRLKKRLLIFDPNDPTIRGLGKSAAIVILPDDQTDATIEQSLCDKILVRPFQHRLEYPSYIPLNQPTAWWTFTDALGNPIPRAVVTIFLSDYDNLTKVKIKTVTLDDAGRLKTSGIPHELKQLFLVISHPDYGIAAFDTDQPDRSSPQGTIPLRLRSRDKTFRIPLTKAGTKPDESSIWGIVLNNKGRPVPGAVIHCSFVQTLGGGTIRASNFMPFTVIADQSGRFAMHLPAETSTTERTAIPPNAKYKVIVEAPKALQMLPWSGWAPVGQETTITLERGGYFRTFAFEDANGPVTDQELLEEIFIYIERKDGESFSIKYSDLKNGKMLPLGIYHVLIDNIDKPEFEPVEVTADSPEQIVFKARPPKTKTDILYSGQVVHGITGQSMPGIFIIAAGFYEADFSIITPEQWQQLNQLAANSLPDDPALAPIHQLIPFNRIMRTGPNGQFEIDINPTEKFQNILKSGQSPYGDTLFTCDYLMVFYENYLAVRYKLDEYTPSESDQNSRIELPTIRLYPAAKVIFEPYLEEKDCSIHFRWEISREIQPDWTREFFAFSNKSVYPFIFKSYLAPNVVQSVPIPAGLTPQFELQVKPRKGIWWCPIYTESISAAQGQIIDLGRITIHQEIPIYVKAIDSAGNPIEGLAITHGIADGKRWFGQRQITDSKGMAKFFSPPYYKAAFFVGWHGVGAQTPWQKLIYETKGPQDANSIFTMQLSDDVLEQLFK